MSAPSDKSVMIEGYKVSVNEEKTSDVNGGNGTVRIKEEPMDPEYFTASSSNSSHKNGSGDRTASEALARENSQKIRELLKGLVENKGKELTVKNVVEDLLKTNQFSFDTSVDKSGARDQVSRAKTQPIESGIIQPKSPTRSCSLPKDGLANINEALVEEQVKSKGGGAVPEMVCSVGSKIVLMAPNGTPLQMDMTCYWCNFCSFKSDKRESLLEHVMEHRFHCKYCKYQSFSRADVIHHCTESHEEFSETASTLKYCTFLPDYLQSDSQSQKRKRGNVEESGEKRRRSSNKDQSEVATPSQPPVERVRKATARKSMPSPSNQLPVKMAATPVKLVPGVGTSIPQFVPADTTQTPNLSGGLPVISNVMSGQKAVSAATAGTGTAEQKKPSSITVSSGLCWNCGYCGFVTLSQAFLKIHLNTHHPGKAHKYVAMLVSSEDEMNRIKQSDSLLITNPPAAGVGNPASTAMSVSATGIGARSVSATVVGSSASQIEIDNAESEEVQNKSEEEASKIPQSYKCAHCNFSSPLSEKVKVHLLQRHMGSVMYALDMRAVKLKQRRYVFFCMKSRCGFSTKDMDDYQEHIESCTPWLDGNDREGIDAAMIKSLELTRQFTTKVGSSNQGLTRDLKTDKAAEYACIYCSYLSSNNTRLKKHVLANHRERSCIIKDLQAAQKHRSVTVYFCRLCLWESRDGSELELHMRERHNESASIVEPPMMSVSSPAPEDPPQLQHKQVRKISSTPYSSQESSPAPSVSTSEQEYDSQDDDEYNGLVSDADVEKAMTEYIADESSREKTSGRPSREAAVKAHIKVRTVGKQPPLFRCIQCSEIAFGVRLIRRHIRDNHTNAPLRAIDIKQKSKGSYQSFSYICPVDECPFCGPTANDVVQHAKKEHGLAASDTDLIKISNIFKPPSVTASPSVSHLPDQLYECLYCSSSKVFHSKKDVKSHLLAKHESEEFVFRDVLARRKLQKSRMYMCPADCEFFTAELETIVLHKLAHKKAHVFHCSSCDWCSEQSEDISKHYTDGHGGKHVGFVQYNLDLDEQGDIVKTPAVTAIKKEPV